MLNIKFLAKLRKPILILSLLLCLGLSPVAVAKEAPEATSTDTTTNSADSAPTPSQDSRPNASNPLGCGTAMESQCIQDGNPDLSKDCDLKCFMANDVEPVLKVLTALIIIAILANIIFGGIQYMTADDRAEAANAAKKRISRNVITLLIYLLLFAFSQFLIPGGIFNG